MKFQRTKKLFKLLLSAIITIPLVNHYLKLIGNSINAKLGIGTKIVIWMVLVLIFVLLKNTILTTKANAKIEVEGINLKNKDGTYGTADWATKEEIKEFLSEVSKLSQEVVEGKTVLTVSPKNDAYTAHTSSSFVGQVLEKAGFVNAVQSEEFEQSLSLEQLVEINPDIIIYMRDDKDKTIYSQWKDTELYNSLDAVKNDQVFTTVARGPWTQYRGFISVKTIVNEVEGWLLNK